MTPDRIQIGKVIRDGIVFDFKNWPADSMNADSLPQTISRLFDLLKQRNINYVLVGGVALLTYVEGRNTQDIDLIMTPASLKKVPEIKISQRERYFARGAFESVQIDLLLTENPLFEKVRQKYAQARQFAEQEIPTATVEGLLLLKLYALPSLYRQGSFTRVGIYENDIAALLHHYPVSVEALEEELGPHLNESDMAEVRAILTEIQQRAAQFYRRSRQT